MKREITEVTTPTLPTQILSRRQLAKFLGVNYVTVSSMTKRGEIPCISLGRRKVYRLDSVMECLKKLEKYEAPQPTTSATNP